VLSCSASPPFGTRMRANLSLLAITMVLAASAAGAQPTEAAALADCKAELATVERDMDEARSRGQMLRRRQLAETRDALQARCAPAAPLSREAQIANVEKDIRDLRTELDRAQEELRKLKSAVP